MINEKFFQRFHLIYWRGNIYDMKKESIQVSLGLKKLMEILSFFLNSNTMGPCGRLALAYVDSIHNGQELRLFWRNPCQRFLSECVHLKEITGAKNVFSYISVYLERGPQRYLNRNVLCKEWQPGSWLRSVKLNACSSVSMILTLSIKKNALFWVVKKVSRGLSPGALQVLKSCKTHKISEVDRKINVGHGTGWAVTERVALQLPWGNAKASAARGGANMGSWKVIGPESGPSPVTYWFKTHRWLMMTLSPLYELRPLSCFPTP